MTQSKEQEFRVTTEYKFDEELGQFSTEKHLVAFYQFSPAACLHDAPTLLIYKYNKKHGWIEQLSCPMTAKTINQGFITVVEHGSIRIGVDTKILLAAKSWARKNISEFFGEAK